MPQELLGNNGFSNRDSEDHFGRMPNSRPGDLTPPEPNLREMARRDDPVGGDKKDEVTMDQIEAMMMGGRFRTTHFDTFAKDVKQYDRLEAEDKKNVEIVEQMQTDYELMVMQGINEALRYHAKHVDNNKNGYPYESRQAEMTIDTVKDTAVTIEKESLPKSLEAKLWINRMKSDAAWMGANFKIAVENSASLFAKFDVVQQLQVLRVPNRPLVSGDDLQDHFAREIGDDELALDSAEKDRVDQAKIGIKIPAEYKESRFSRPGEQYTGDETLGVREMGVLMTSSAFDARMKIAAVSQVDYRLDTEDAQRASTFMGNNLSKDDFDFYKQLLWRTTGKINREGVFEGKGAILAPNVVSSKRDKRESEAYLEALLITNAVERFDVIKKMAPGAEKQNATSELILQVKGEALDRMTNWKTREDKDIVSAMATLVTKQGLLEDFGFMHGYRYCFRGIWNIDENGRPAKTFGRDRKLKSDMLKEWEAGSIYSQSGDLWSLYYLHRHHSYNKLANSDTPFLEATSKAGRAEMASYPFNKTPSFDEAVRRPDYKDDFMKGQWNFLLSNESEFVEARKRLGYESLPPELVVKLKLWATKYTTPFSVKFLHDLEDRKNIQGTSNYELSFPWFLPEGNGVANFFEAITVGDTKLNLGGKSVMQELIEGKKLYEIDWANPDFENQPVDRWHVDMEMSCRWMKLLIEEFDPEKDALFSRFVGSAGTGGIKELNKRIRLWARDIADGQPEFYEVAFVPMLLTLAVADKYGIYGPFAWEKSSKEELETGTTGVDKFRREMAYWKRALKWMPGDRPNSNLRPNDPDGLKYGNAMALMAEFFETVTLRIAKASAEEADMLAINNYDKSTTWVEDLNFLNRGRFKYTPDPNLAIEK